NKEAISSIVFFPSIAEATICSAESSDWKADNPANNGMGMWGNSSHGGGAAEDALVDVASSLVAEKDRTHSTLPRPLSLETRYGTVSARHDSIRKPALAASSNTSSRANRRATGTSGR